MGSGETGGGPIGRGVPVAAAYLAGRGGRTKDRRFRVHGMVGAGGAERPRNFEISELAGRGSGRAVGVRLRRRVLVGEEDPLPI